MVWVVLQKTETGVVAIQMAVNSTIVLLSAFEIFSYIKPLTTHVRLNFRLFGKKIFPAFVVKTFQNNLVMVFSCFAK